MVYQCKQKTTMLKAAMARCFEPHDSDDWSRASFTARRRLHNEMAREFGNALRRLVSQAYPSADDHTRDLLARDHFIMHSAAGEFRVSLRSAKPETLEDAIDLTAEIELLRALESTHVTSDAKVRGVVENKPKTDEEMEVLLGVVEGLCQEVKTLQMAVQALQTSSRNVARDPQGAVGGILSSGGGCWECGCNRHILPISTGTLKGAGTVGPLPTPTHPFRTVASASVNDGSAYVATKIGGLESLLLVDSGAALSVIPKQVWLSITNGGSELMGHEGNVSAANGGAMGVMGKWQTVCQLDSLALVAEFLVADVPCHEILLGFDFLRKYGAVVDFGKMEFQLIVENIPFGSP